MSVEVSVGTGIYGPSGWGTDRSDLFGDFQNFVGPGPVRHFRIFLSPSPVPSGSSNVMVDWSVLVRGFLCSARTFSAYS